jgi:hypothetical protein
VSFVQSAKKPIASVRRAATSPTREAVRWPAIHTLTFRCNRKDRKVIELHSVPSVAISVVLLVKKITEKKVKISHTHPPKQKNVTKVNDGIAQ